jgi:alanine dehydrogenase
MIDISNLMYWNSKKEIFKIFDVIDKIFFNETKIVIIGEGNCGKGVSYLLNKLNIKYDIIYKNDSKNNLIDYDIIYNCINLDKYQNEIWFDSNTVFYKKLLIVDISCDYLKNNNPIKLYNEPTTFIKPVFNYNKYVDIIALNNLPSLLPFDCSNYFSNIFINILLEKNDDKNNIWKNNENIFLNL